MLITSGLSDRYENRPIAKIWITGVAATASGLSRSLIQLGDANISSITIKEGFFLINFVGGAQRYLNPEFVVGFEFANQSGGAL